MKHLLFCFIFIFCNRCFAQSIDFCKYIHLQINKETDFRNGNPYIQIKSVKNKNDKLSTFIDEHSARFLYIIYNKIDSISNYTQYYPNTILANNIFCNRMNSLQFPEKYFNYLIPQKYSNKQQALQFSTAEMMQVASRFFYIDGINRKDTTASAHFCVGINAQKEIVSNKDLTVLQALCIDAIIENIDHDNPQIFEKNFYTTSNTSLKKNILKTTNDDELLQIVRKEVYDAMEKDKDLESMLLSYFTKNKNNLGIAIQGNVN